MSWRHDTKQIVKRYPIHKMELEQLRMPHREEGMPGSATAGRTTENIALVQLPRNEQREYDAVDFAIRCLIANYPRDYKDHLRLIHELYWGAEKLTIEGAAMRIPCSVETAKKWNSAFLQSVDACMMIMRARF